MRILLTNDDGIYAKGIEVLYLALIEEHEVTVVAPETEQSAVGHAITLLDPLRVKTVHRNGHSFGHSLSGTPADCVKIAVSELMPSPPDMVLSGVNKGANVGVNVIYSGTVSAATEAALMGIPSIAVSIDSITPSDFSAVNEFVPKLVRAVAKRGLPPGISLNVNIPHVSADRVRGIRITKQGNMRSIEKYDRRVDPRNRTYYWLCNIATLADEDPACDSAALASRCISITPIHHDLTDYEAVKALSAWDLQ